MSIARMEFFSPAIGKQASYNILLPDVGEGPFPVLIQLHGLSDDCNAWIERSNIVRHAADLPLVIVFPDGGTHGYLNWKGGGRLARGGYEDLVVNDIAAHVKRHFHVRDEPWAIGGLSMGGWGALHLGLKHHERFSSIWAHSSKIYWKENEADPTMLAEPGDLDLMSRVERLQAAGTSPVVTFDCGVDDFLIDENRAFHAHLDQIGFDHTYREHPGAHTWDYWDDHVREALDQHARVLGIDRIQPE